jgi:DNA processing protein
VDQLQPVAVQRLALLLAGGGRRSRRLVAAAGRGDDLLTAIASADGGKPLAEAARGLLGRETEAVLGRSQNLGWRWITPGDQAYPALLPEISDPPLGLFVRGLLAPGPVIAIVGSRQATAYGRQVARLLAEELGRAGVVVASGMARGVDAAAHRGVLEAGGVTVAVWGTGPDRVYPSEHRGLAEEIANAGALVTEYPPGTPPRRHHFPERNRVLAGLAEAVVVVEARARSGALITARQAVDEGREVLAVPGSILSELSIGPNALLRLGARPLVSPADALDALGISPPPPPPSSRELLTAELPLAPGEEMTADELARRSGREVHELQADLLQLELEGLIERGADGRYCRR